MKNLSISVWFHVKFLKIHESGKNRNSQHRTKVHCIELSFWHSNLKITLGKVRNLIGKKCWMWLLCKFCQKKAHIFGFSFSSLFLLQRWRWCLPWEQKIDIFQIEFEVLFSITRVSDSNTNSWRSNIEYFSIKYSNSSNNSNISNSSNIWPISRKNRHFEQKTNVLVQVGLSSINFFVKLMES